MLNQLICRVLVLLGLLLASLLVSQNAIAKPDIEPKAMKILLQMSEYMNTLDDFSFHIENSVDILLDSGMKIQRARSIYVSVSRPNRLRADIDGDILKQQLFYDGKSITLYEKRVNYYATMDAPGKIESAFEKAEKTFGLVAPASDLIFKNSYDVLSEGLLFGSYEGLSTVSGVECHHLAFRGEDTDWQIWIENSKNPLPKKFVITSRWVTGAPQIASLFSDWDITAQLDDSMFTFDKQSTADKIDFLPVIEGQ